jgi:hypothetical protein
MRMLVSLAAAAALAVGLGIGGAYAADDEDVENPFIPTIEAPDTTFDLGIDVGELPKTPAAVRAYLAGLAPLTRDILISTCEHYMVTPNSVQESETLAFCSVAVGG